MLYFNMGKFILAEHQPVLRLFQSPSDTYNIHKHGAYALSSDNHFYVRIHYF